MLASAVHIYYLCIMITKSDQLELFDNIPIDGFVTWIKLPAYQVAWMYTRYGFPCVLPSTNRLARVMREGIVRNLNRARLHDCSCTDEMMRHNLLNISDEDKLCFVPIALPTFLNNGKGTTKRMNGTYQINAQHTIAFRKEVRNQFWYDLTEYIHKTTYHARINKRHITYSKQLDDWMSSRGIDTVFYEIIDRQYHKDMSNDRKEIEETLKTTDYKLRTTERAILEGLRRRKESGRAKFRAILQSIKKT